MSDDLRLVFSSSSARFRFSPTASMLSVAFESDDGSSSIDDVSIAIGSTEAGAVRILVATGSSLISIDDVSIGSGSIGVIMILVRGWEVRVPAAAERSSSNNDDDIGSGGRWSRSVIGSGGVSKVNQIHQTLNPTRLDDFTSVQLSD